MESRFLVLDDGCTFSGVDDGCVAEIPHSFKVDDDDIEYVLKHGEWEDFGETVTLPVRRLVALPDDLE